MEKLSLHWNIIGKKSDESVIRYCHSCGKKVEFKDSKVRRENANGNNIYRFAIYKCDKGHTWNKTLKKFKSFKNMKENLLDDGEKYDMDKLFSLIPSKDVDSEPSYELSYNIHQKECDYIEIHVNIIEGRIRLDKLIASKFSNISRTKAKEMIKTGAILVDNTQVKGNFEINHSCILTLNT
ncbi:DUF1062 domain-containing protein [Oceanirhabdus seepicola]|uniref:DUF1062 domain-containing protein n=1 Tax=Oceanirhabdus seepicola TaxID=2828781 RepID=A0A9J6NZ82_9CLOT|nr:DUF1062 domain-containing protein [Oceanirhabdus seepicola]MCM1989738.1 DUF1062 domain-containing protein [Oceanirhabdus seepicola]